MHLANGMVTPMCAVYGSALATIGAAAASLVFKKALTCIPKPAHFAAATASIFALQAFNVPVLGGVTGHMVGGFLLAYWFGALWGIAGITLVLLAQGLMFGDGGMHVIGLNVVNMGLIPALLVFPLWKMLAGKLTGRKRTASIAVAAWAATVIASLACGIEIHGTSLGLIGTLVGVHALIGLIEAAFTVAAIELVKAFSRNESRWLMPAAIVALTVVAVTGASPWPDGLESSLARHGIAEAAQQATVVFSDYSVLSALLVATMIAGMAAGIARIAVSLRPSAQGNP